jgi:hypothetical protein
MPRGKRVPLESGDTMIVTSKDKKPDDAQVLRNIADKINAKRRAELLAIQNGHAGFLKELHEVRESEIFKHGNKDKSARLVASIPYTYWKFLENLYESQTGSKKFHEDIKFMRENCPEFLVVHKKDL